MFLTLLANTTLTICKLTKFEKVKRIFNQRLLMLCTKQCFV